MEKPLDRQLEDILGGQGVTGALCTDRQGMCLAARGSCQSEAAGTIASLAQQAAALQPEARETPVICIESDAGMVLIKTHDSITTAVYKMPS